MSVTTHTIRSQSASLKDDRCDQRGGGEHQRRERRDDHDSGPVGSRVDRDGVPVRRPARVSGGGLGGVYEVVSVMTVSFLGDSGWKPMSTVYE